jgi:sigma-E factor negative regulatory protein RseB
VSRARWVSVGLTAATVAAVVSLGPSVVAQPSSQGAQLLAAARRAANRASYDGVVVVSWREGGTLQQSRALAQVAGGTVEMGEGDQDVVSLGGARWVGSPGAWNLVLGPGAPSAPAPALDANWTLLAAPGPLVAGRPTMVVSAVDPTTGATRARFYIDVATDTLLRQDILDPDGALVRQTRFEVLVPLPAASAPTTPSDARPDEPTALAAVPSGYQAPRDLGRGYRLLGQYRQPDGTLQLYYSDGLFTLSLFEQRGAIDWSALPPGTAGKWQGIDLRSYAASTTGAVVWGSHGLVITCVSDAPPDQATLAVHDVIGGGSSNGTLGKIAHFVLGPFGWN